jgi:hypothetical protein
VKPQLLAEVPAKEVVAILAVCQAHQAQEALQEDQDAQESREHQDCQETQANHPSNLANQSLHHHASLVQLVHQGHPVLQAPLGMLANRAHQATQEATPHPENQDQRDHQAHLAARDNQDHPENQELQLNHPHLNPDLPDQSEMLAHPDPQALQDSQDQMQDQDPLDPKDPQARQAHLETTANRAHQDNLERQEMPERRVSARNTAPSMEVSSSRMEHAVVKMEWLAGLGPFKVSTTLAHFILLFIQFKHQKISFNGNVFNLA